MKRKLSVILLAAALALTVGLVPASATEAALIAGQNTPVGTVTVTDDGTTVCVTYKVNDGWLLFETHLYVGDASFSGVKNKRGNPVPGQFPYGDDDLGGVKEAKYFVPLVGSPSSLTIAAHAVVEQVIQAAPYGGSSVFDWEQGYRTNGSSVNEGRSHPLAALTRGTTQVETAFFSLGFMFDEPGVQKPEGGWIIIEFDCPIFDGEGNDVMVVEDTWGLPYPLERAAVYASQDGAVDSWILLGVAENQTPSAVKPAAQWWQTVSSFDLLSTGLPWAKFIKVVDTTPIGPDMLALNPAYMGDGFDLNAVLSLQDCVGNGETAWGAGYRFLEIGNWGMHFTHPLTVN